MAVSFLICIASWLYRVCALVCELSLAFHLWSAITRSSCRLSPRRAACCPLEATRPTKRGGTLAFGNRALWFSDFQSGAQRALFVASVLRLALESPRVRQPVSILLGVLLRGGHADLVPSAVRKWLGEPCRGPHPPRDDPGCRYAGVSFAPARPQQQPLPLLTATPRGGGDLLCRQIFFPWRFNNFTRTLVTTTDVILLELSAIQGCGLLSRI